MTRICHHILQHLDGVTGLQLSCSGADLPLATGDSRLDLDIDVIKLMLSESDPLLGTDKTVLALIPHTGSMPEDVMPSKCQQLGLQDVRTHFPAGWHEAVQI